jgi:hypothetical protein
MKRIIALVTALILAATIGWVLTARSAPGPKVISLSAPAFSPRDYSTHNNGTPVCGAAVLSETGGEVRGDMDNSEGSFFHTVQLPDGVRVTRVRLVANDNDGDNDVHAYLVRRNIENNTENTKGYWVMGRASSSGAVLNTLRAFSDNTINAPNIDNRRHVYFVELVDCGVPEPYTVQVFYERP